MAKSVLRIKILLLAMWTIIGFCILGCSIWLWSIDYNSFASIALDLTDKQALRSYFETSVLPPERFETIRYLLLLFIFIWGLCTYWLSKNILHYSQLIHGFIIRSKNTLNHQIQQTNKTEKLILFSILIAFALRGLWQMYSYELQYDEAWTYNHFVSKGFIISAISPNNNHILYCLFACITDYLPLEAKYSLRLPVYLGGIATCLLFYCLVRSLCGWTWALVALAWFAFSPGVVFYSMYARGYIFQLFFTILTLWATLKILSNDNIHYHWSIWVIANVLGMYSVPTYAYVLIAFNFVLLVSILFRKSIKLKPWIASNLMVVLLTSILYFSFFLTNGFEILIHIASGGAPHGEPFISYQDKVADWLILGAGRLTSVYWVLLLLIFSLLFLLVKNRNVPEHRNPVAITILFLLLPSLLNLITGTQPPYRVWCFLTVFIALFIGFLGSYVVPKGKIAIPIALALIIFSFWRTEVHYAVRWSAGLDNQAVKVARLLLDNKINECYFFSNYDKPLLECYYLRAGKKLKTAMIATDSKNYAPFVNSKVYESVLWDKEDRVALAEEIKWLDQHYPKKIYQNDRIEIRTPL